MADENKEQKAQSSKKEQSDEERQQAGLDKALEEMENDFHVDETAATVVYPADLGTSAHAESSVPSTSPGILAQVRNERRANADPDRHNKQFARDVLGLDVEVDDDLDEREDTVYGGEKAK